MTAKHFHNFDGLRFFSAVIVVLGHIESFKLYYFNLPSYYNTAFFINSGPIAVEFFFVLSGFLITYLLMIEKQASEQIEKNISIFKFYRNRILRIWPLYYSLIILVFFLLPNIPLFHIEKYNENFINKTSFNQSLLYTVFCPNMSEYFYGNVSYLGQLWSLGIEEFFYLFFPLGIYFLRSKNFLKYFVIIATISLLITSIRHIEQSFYTQNADKSLLAIYLDKYQLYTFAFGSIGAYYFPFFQHNPLLQKYLYLIKCTGYLLFFLITALVLSGKIFPFFSFITYAILFSALIFCLSVSNIKITALNRPFIVYMGKISYGIYMLHPLAIVISIKLFYFDTGNDLLTAIILDGVTVLITIFISTISYKFLEKPFLKLRTSRKYLKVTPVSNQIKV